MIAQQTKDQGRETLAPLLDESLARLGSKEREAVLLRYLECRSVAESAQAMGISAKAAEKRAERGLEKLRRHFAAEGYAVPNVAGVLAGAAAYKAPTALVAAMGGKMAMSTTAIGLAKGAGNMMMWAKVKVAAGIEAVVILGGTVGIGGSMWLGKPGAQPSTLAGQPSPKAPAIEDEIAVPGGKPRVYRHELVVEEGLCQAILKDAVRIPSQGQGWEVYQLPSRTLRGWLNGAPQGRVYYSFEHGPSLGTPEDRPGEQSPFANFYSYFSSFMIEQPRANMVTIAPRGNISNVVWTDNGKVRFSLSGEDWKIGINGLRGGSIVKQGTLSVDASVPPGESLLAVMRLGQLHDGQYAFITAFEVFNATAAQAAQITDLRDTQRWVAMGPALCRRIADSAITWRRKAAPASTEPTANWVRRLEDGTVVQLETISQPDRWPGIEWDGDGRPVATVGMSDWAGQPGSVRLRGHVKWSTPPLSTMLSGRSFTPFDVDKPSSWCEALPRDGREVTLRVGVGQFQNAGRIEQGKPIQVGPLVFRLRDLQRSGESWQSEYTVEGTGLERVSYALVPVVITKGGQQVGPEDYGMEWYRFTPSPEDAHRKDRERLSARFYRRAGSGDKQDEFDHLELLWRKMEPVTFSGMKLEPIEKPQPDLEDAIAKAGQVGNGKAASIPRMEVPKAAELPPDKQPAVTMQLILAAAAEGDQQKIRSHLAGKEEPAKLFAELLVTALQFQASADERLGAMPQHQLTDILAEFNRDLLESAIARQGDALVTSENLLFRPDGHGGWLLDVDESFRGQLARQSDQRLFRLLGDSIRQTTADLKAGKIATPNDLTSAMDQTMAKVMAAQRAEQGE